MMRFFRGRDGRGFEDDDHGLEDDGHGFEEAPPPIWERVAELWYRRTDGGPASRLGAAVRVALAPFRGVVWALDAAAGAAAEAAAAARDSVGSRRLRHLLQGLPALAAAAAVAGVAALALSKGPELPNDYRSAAAEAFGAERFAESALLYERLFRLDGGTAETRLFLGLALDGLGRGGEAEDLIRGVADGDAGGDPRANRWVAERLLSDPDAVSRPDRMREAHRHLLAAERGLPADPSVKVQLVKFYLATGQTARAVPKLEWLAAADPALNLDLAQVYASVGKSESAKAALGRAEAHFRERLEYDAADRRSRLLLANCLAGSGRVDEAVTVLREGAASDPEGPYGKALARTYVAAYDRLAARPSKDYPAMIGVLREALRWHPNSPDAATRLVGFADGGDGLAKPDAESDREATRLLEELLARGDQPPAAHMALGLKAWRRGDSEDARWHFERAYDLDDTLVGVANNLAWSLARQEDPSPADLERALAIITPVIERAPEVPSYLDTRGEIYLKMRRWRDALRDLEKALPTLRSDPRLHLSLAEAYAGLGKERIARRHRDEADRLSRTTSRTDPVGAQKRIEEPETAKPPA